MKVLIAAIACHPTAGSEAYVGWQAVSVLRRDHELCVLTSLSSREAIERAVKSGEGWDRVRFVYVDEARGALPSHPNRMIARLQSWTDYRRWCRDAGIAARQLMKREGFDLAHHVTYATWRMGSPLAGLGIPWIWGPVGGGELFPWRLIGVLSPVAAFFEIIRACNTKFAKHSRSVRDAVRDATLILPNNPETERLMLELGAPAQKLRRLYQSFLSKERLNLLNPHGKAGPREIGFLKIVAGGNLEGRKGVALALGALPMLKQRGIPFRYTYLGRGPELEHLRQRAFRLGLAAEVHFLESLSGEKYAEALKDSHVYLLPSLREGVPLTQMEAMAAGCVPVVVDCGGAGPMARAAGCRPVKSASAILMEREIAGQLEDLWNNPVNWNQLSQNAVNAVSGEYSRSFYGREMNRLYERIGTGKLHATG